MRKRITTSLPDPASLPETQWLDLARIAQVEITSEDANHPIESALIAGNAGSGWKAGSSGEQTLRLLFDEPQKLKHIRLVFSENEYERTQEFVLAWSTDGLAYHDIVRQQYNFSPSTTEVEEYDVNLEGAKTLRLKIVPNISGGETIASLTELRVA